MTFRVEEQILTSFKARFGIAHTAISNRDWFAELFGAGHSLYSSEIWLQFAVGSNYYAYHDDTVILDSHIRRSRIWNGTTWVSTASGNVIPVEKVTFPLAEILSTNGQSHIALAVPQTAVNASDVLPSQRLRDFIQFADYGTDFLPRIYWDDGTGTAPGTEITTTVLPYSWIWDPHSGILLFGADTSDQFVPTGNFPIWIQHYRYVGSKGIEELGMVEVACLTSDAIGDPMCIRGDRVNGKWRVQKADALDGSKMPAVGILIDKTTPTVGKMQMTGPIRDIFTGLNPGKSYHVNSPSFTVAPPVPGMLGYSMAQILGYAAASDILVLTGNILMTRRIA